MAYMWIPIRDGTYEAVICDEFNSSTKWNKDGIILHIAILVLCLEILIVSLTLCSVFCYLRWVYNTQRQLTTWLKHFIYHTGICSVVVGLAILWSTYFLYRYYRYPSEVSSATIIIVYTIGAVIGPLALLISAVFQTLSSPFVTKTVNTVKRFVRFAIRPDVK
jgi:hypothetical protein